MNNEKKVDTQGISKLHLGHDQIINEDVSDVLV